MRLRNMSIFMRMVLALYLVAVLLVLIVSAIGAQVAGDEVEKRLVHDAADSSARMLERLNLPMTRGVLSNLSDVLGAKVAITSQDGRILGASFDSDNAGLATIESSGPLTVGDRHYIVGRRGLSMRSLPDQGAYLCLLVPEQKILTAKDRTTRRIMNWTLAVVALATVLALAISLTITRPIRFLAREAGRLKQQIVDDPESRTLDFAAPESGPGEVIELGHTFSELVKNLAESQDRLARLERLAALGKIAASVAHEIRNPLSGIKMNVRLLQDSVNTTNGNGEKLDVIRREIDRMDLYLGELMALARSGGQGTSTEVKLEPVELRDQARHVIHLLERKISHSGVSLDQDFPETPMPVLADGGRVRQVIMNLMLNAFEAVGSGGRIRLAITPKGDQVRFSVFDNGPGVEAVADVFEAFVSTKFSGAGLGLYLCRRIIQDHEGEIGYDRNDGETEFWFELKQAHNEDNP